MKALRVVGLALLLSLLVGFLVGTALRARLERAPVYIGMDPTAQTEEEAT